jgi:hypothetical protein
MQIQNLDKIIYQLTVEDLQNVANEELDRNLTEDEIKILEDKIVDCLWQKRQAICESERYFTADYRIQAR